MLSSLLLPRITMPPISILYEEPHFLVVNKPAALFSQAPEGIDSLQARLITQLKQRDQHPGEPFVGLPHRLDRGTSGIMLIARNQRALKRFGEQFQSRKVIKHYLAVVEGEFPNVARRPTVGIPAVGTAPVELPTDAEPRWEDYLRKIPDQPRAEVVTSDAEGAKLAIASIQCLQTVAGLCLLRVKLETGRMHQIRVQAASRGLPVVGDASYGAKLPWKPVDEVAGTLTVDQPADAQSFDLQHAQLDRTNQESHNHPPVALHAWSLEFRHPQTAITLRFVAPVPANWQQLPDEIRACFPENSITIAK